LRIAHGALLNLTGHAAPLLAALFALPALIDALGPERFGFLALAWALVGYFSLFDLGLARALSRLVAERRGSAGEAELPALSGGALSLTFALGFVGGLLLYASAEWICGRMLKLPPAMLQEGTAAVRILAACLPLVTLTAALRGLLEGARYFGWVNAIRVPLGILTFVAPLAVVSEPSPLPAVCAVLAGLRIFALAAHWAVCWKLMRPLAVPRLPGREVLQQMLGYGAWITVSNVVGPLMVYADRFVIGALISVAAVGYYAAPYEVLTRIWVLPAALTGALFPALAAATVAEARALQRKGVLAILATAVPIALIAGLLAPFWMSLWLGEDYATQGARVAQWLAFGIAVSCLAHIPLTLLQARGRADLTGMLHFAELPFYLGLLWILIRSHGIEGAAIAWSVRCLADSLILFLLVRQQLRREAR
jgi:O-antigen/teichoic acid export membrane protein